MKGNSVALWLTLVAATFVMDGCSTREVAGTAAGGAAGYEISNKRAMDQLNDDYRNGRIDKAEYERRKKEIEHRSVVY